MNQNFKIPLAHLGWKNYFCLQNFVRLNHLELGGIRSGEFWDGQWWNEFPLGLLTNGWWTTELSNFAPQFDSFWWRKMPAGDWGKLHVRPINEQKISQRVGSGCSYNLQRTPFRAEALWLINAVWSSSQFFYCVKIFHCCMQTISITL